MADNLTGAPEPEDGASGVLPIVEEQNHGAARQAISAGLRSFNRDRIGPVDRRPLTFTLRHGEQIVGGVGGETYMGWLFIDALWVAVSHRGSGHAARLMDAAEAEARSRGAIHAYVDTFSFQAPGFYAKLGYREFGRLDEFPAGHRRHFLTKTL